VRVDRRMRVAALRHMGAQGAFAQQCKTTFGVALPDALCAVEVPGAPAGHECILAWRQPTQTLALVSDGQAFANLLAELPPTDDGCCVDQSGGLWVLRLSGARVPDLLLRIGNAACVVSPGQAHVSRMAELTVLSLCIKPGETLLLLDRSYVEHLLGWMRATAADLSLGAGA
jgi:hypothetical protein